jgi:hypothetical protein
MLKMDQAHPAETQRHAKVADRERDALAGEGSEDIVEVDLVASDRSDGALGDVDAEASSKPKIVQNPKDGLHLGTHGVQE